MLVDEIGDVTITNDGATILRQLEVEHPAARVLVDLAALQDNEVGDGTTSVVIMAGELLKRAYELIKLKVHPSIIIEGYKVAMKESIKFIKQNLKVDVETLKEGGLVNVAKTSMSSKLIGPECDYFAELAVKACLAVTQNKKKFLSRTSRSSRTTVSVARTVNLWMVLC
jgi:T-complex protein 1 subunit alpha